MFQETELGWVVAGLITDKTTTNVHTFIAQTINKENVDLLQNQLARFWNLEEITTANHHDQDGKRCVEHFEKTVKRGDDGKFVIQLPVTKEVEKLGNSRVIAQKRFFALENQITQIRTRNRILCRTTLYAETTASRQKYVWYSTRRVQPIRV